MRLVAPMPVTRALMPFDLEAARWRNMRSGGMLVPVRATTRSSWVTRAGCVAARGS